MNRRSAAVFVAAVFLISLGLIATWWWTRDPEPEPAEEETVAPVLAEPSDSSLEALLYFPGQGGLLYAERREVPGVGDLEEQILVLVEQLLRGPEQASLYPPLPSGVRVTGVHLLAEGVAYLDLLPPEDPAALAWGSKREILSAYSVVNTIVLNLPDVRAVVLLWNGQQRSTFAGHLDTTRPLTANRKLVGG